MKLKCSNGHLNDSGQARCSVCDVSLRFAEQVHEESVPGASVDESRAAESRQASEDSVQKEERNDPPVDRVCLCNEPQLLPGTDECDVCGGILDENRRQSQNSLQPASADKHSIATVGLRLPGGANLVVGTGLLLGRDVTPQVARALEGYSGVSRVHAWVGVLDDSLLVIDLDSTNGTRVGETLVSPSMPYKVTLDRLPIELGLGKKAKIKIARQDET